MAKKKKTVKSAKKTGAKKKSGLTQQTYTLSNELQAIVGSGKMTRPQIVKKLWVYIKAHKCQDTKNRRMICPDKKLSEVIGKKPVDMLKLAGHLNKHIKK
jgi:chromatin remodeling complex protein RSC6